MNAESPLPIEGEVVVRPRRRRIRRVLLVVVPLAILLAVGWAYLTGGRYESTENAMLQAGMVAISPSVAGKVVAVEVRENQQVRKGDVLFRIESASFETAVADAEAQLADARSDVGSLTADLRAAEAEINAALSRQAHAQREAARQRSLQRDGISSRAQAEAAALEAATARDAIAAARARAESLRARLATAEGGQPEVRKAASRLAKARIDLGDTVVVAPQDGVVTKVNQLQVGNWVQPGRAVFLMTGLKFWVVANFKENQLRYMRVGQPATIEVDAFPDSPLKGHVESFSPGTGNSFSILPAENATGNWVKVVQRLPVQIAIDQVPDRLPLSTGLSVSVEVDTGHRRHLLGPDTAPSEPGRAASPARP